MDHRDMEKHGLSSERDRMTIILLASVHFSLQRNEEPPHHLDVSQAFSTGRVPLMVRRLSSYQC